jgi:hypothetical protein
MSEAFHSTRFGKRVWLTNHAIEAMAKRRVTLDQVKTLVELGTYLDKGEGHGWIFHRFESEATISSAPPWSPGRQSSSKPS